MLLKIFSPKIHFVNHGEVGEKKRPQENKATEHKRGKNRQQLAPRDLRGGGEKKRGYGVVGICQCSVIFSFILL